MAFLDLFLVKKCHIIIFRNFKIFHNNNYNNKKKDKCCK